MQFSRWTAAAIFAALAITTPGLNAQAIAPDPDPQFTDSCGRKSTLGTEDYQGNVKSILYESFVTSAVNLSPAARTATLPLHQGTLGTPNGTPVYYILTDVSDCDEARTRGLNYAPKLGFLVNPTTGEPVNKSVMKVKGPDVNGDGIVFTGTADYSPVRIFTPNQPDGWPPAASQPGSNGDGNYTPFVSYKVGNKYVVANASQVANSTGVKDFIPEIDFSKKTVKFNLVTGIYNFAFVMYLRMDASDTVITGFEGGIYAPNPELAPGGGLRSFAAGQTRQTILPIINGIRGVGSLNDRQGIQSSALGEGDPLNVMGATPGENEYSPIWDLTPVVWTDAAIAAGKRQRLHQDDEVRNFVQAGLVVGAVPASANTPFNADIGVNSFGVVSNCPILLRVLQGIPAYAGGK